MLACNMQQCFVALWHGQLSPVLPPSHRQHHVLDYRVLSSLFLRVHAPYPAQVWDISMCGVILRYVQDEYPLLSRESSPWRMFKWFARDGTPKYSERRVRSNIARIKHIQSELTSADGSILMFEPDHNLAKPRLVCDNKTLSTCSCG